MGELLEHQVLRLDPSAETLGCRTVERSWGSPNGLLTSANYWVRFFVWTLIFLFLRTPYTTFNDRSIGSSIYLFASTIFGTLCDNSFLLHAPLFTDIFRNYIRVGFHQYLACLNLGFTEQGFSYFRTPILGKSFPLSRFFLVLAYNAFRGVAFFRSCSIGAFLCLSTARSTFRHFHGCRLLSNISAAQPFARILQNVSFRF